VAREAYGYEGKETYPVRTRWFEGDGALNKEATRADVAGHFGFARQVVVARSAEGNVRGLDDKWGGVNDLDIMETCRKGTYIMFR
jgi:hypothetical protein